MCALQDAWLVSSVLSIVMDYLLVRKFVSFPRRIRFFVFHTFDIRAYVVQEPDTIGMTNMTASVYV